MYHYRVFCRSNKGFDVQVLFYFAKENFDLPPAFIKFTVTPATSGSAYTSTYTARTKININTIPGLVGAIEKYKQDGKVFVKYRHFSNQATGNNPVSHAGANAGWADLTAYANSYVKAVAYGTDNLGTVGVKFDGPFMTTPYSTGGVTNVNPFIGVPYLTATTAAYFGATGSGDIITLAANQTARAYTNTTAMPVTNRTINVDGNIVINWNITSGTALATTLTNFGPMTLTNTVPTAESPTWMVALNGTRVARAFETGFYSGTLLTSNKTINAAHQIVVNTYGGGQPASYFANHKLVQVQVFVLTGDQIKAAKLAGINVDSPEALINFSTK